MREQEPNEEYAQGEYADAYEEEQPNAYTAAFQQEQEQMYEEPVTPPHSVSAAPRPQIISTNMTINLTCTLCAICGLFALFLRFADTRSKAVRRFAVQSAGLTCTFVFCSVCLWVVSLLLGWLPLVGGFFTGLLGLVWVALLCGDVYLRWRMMTHAYRGEAYILPLIGEKCREFE